MSETAEATDGLIVNKPPTAEVTTFLPEPTWLFRRLTTWAVLLSSSFALAYIIHALAKLGDAGALERIGHALIITKLVVVTIYLVAPTQEYVRRIAELVRAAKGGSTA